MLLLLQMLLFVFDLLQQHSSRALSPFIKAYLSGSFKRLYCLFSVHVASGLLEQGFRPIRATVTRKSEIISPLTSRHLISKV